MKDFTEILAPHLQLTIQELSSTKSVRTGKWLPDFEATLSQAINKALLLKARLAVAPVEYSMTWYPSGSLLDRATMKEFNEAPANKSSLSVAITVLPGWKRGDVVVSRAHVRLDVMKGEL